MWPLYFCQKMKIIYYILSVLLLSLIYSCENKNNIKTPDVRDAINRNGPIEVPPVRDGKKVVMYWSAGGFAFSMEDVPHGKIDGIIKDNPDWQFIFYVYCKSDEDVELVKAWLKYIGDDFAVRIDRKDAFKKANRMMEYDSIGFILDSEGNRVGLSVIGTPRSRFDSEFRKAKQIIKY